MRFHPAVQILTWCMLVVLLQKASNGTLLLASGVILMCALAWSGHKFILLMRRTRWVVFSMLLVYSYITPGQPILDIQRAYIPTIEGILEGLLQLLRILSALAGLAILLERLHRQQLVSSFTVDLPNSAYL